MNHKIILLGVLPLLIYQYIFGQTSSKTLEPQDYIRWELLQRSNIKSSSDAQYISYTIQDGTGKQNQMVKSLEKGKARTYADIRNAEFLNFRKHFVYINNKDSLIVESFEGRRLFQVPKVVGFQTVSDGRFLLLSDKNMYSQELKEIRILDMTDFTIKTISKISALSVDPEKKKIALFAGQDSETVFSIFEPSRGTITYKDFPRGYKAVKMEWSPDARSLTFMLQKQGEDRFADSVGVILDVTSGSSFQMLDLKKVKGWDNLTLARYSSGYPILSYDKKKLFLQINLVEQADAEAENVEIWKSRARWIYPYRKGGDAKSKPKLGAINLETQTFTMITTPSETESLRDMKDRYALTFDESPYQPAYKFGEDHFDMRLVDLNIGKEYIVDTFIKDYGRRIMFVEALESFIYYNDSHWYLHNPSTRKNIKITQNIPNLITECVNCNQGLAIGENNKHFYVFDLLDLWQVDAAGNGPKKLTNGNESGIEFRFALSYYGYGKSGRILQVDPVNGIYLQAFNRKTGNTGYFKWTISRGLEKIVFGPMKYEDLQVLPNNKGYLYTRQTFDRSPEIIWQPALKDAGQVEARSNVQQSEYQWGRSEMVQYRSPRGYRSNGRELNGALFYPANYDSTKKYPLIVSIYEDNTYTLHEYQNPGCNKFIDFNPTDYTLDGYFVLHPNLRPRETANPGHSMMENLQAALDYMKGTGMIDEKRIGLYGHSFGGYEALFAASQTKDFATIIAGAAIADVVTDYFSHRSLLRGPSFYRTEQMQHSMKRNYFEIPELYEANSPFRYIPRINTPILLWTGKDDTNVGAEQSVQFYLGMLRLNKECTMLMYPNENHVLSKPENVQDLDKRMRQWFGHFLKGEPKQEWMKSEKTGS